MPALLPAFPNLMLPRYEVHGWNFARMSQPPALTPEAHNALSSR